MTPIAVASDAPLRAAMMEAVTSERLSPFVGRTVEVRRLAELSGLLEEHPAAGHVLIGGDAGVGKTRLLVEFANSARKAGVQVLLGHCLDFGDAALPYLPFSEAFGRLARDEPDTVEALLEKRPAIARLLPAHRMLSAEATRPSEPTDRAAAFEAVYGALVDLGGKAPVLFVLEDLHWADQSTRELLSFLFAREFPSPVAIVGSYRSDDLNRRHPLRASIAAWSRMEGIARLQVGPLGEDEMRALMAALHPAPLDEHDARMLLARAEGSPFFLEELVAAAESGTYRLPDDLADLMLLRLDRIDEEARLAVRAAAVAGRRSSHELLAYGSGLGEDVLDRALRAAIEANVLRARGGETYSFRHALLAEVVYQDLLPGERARLHATYARGMASGEVAGTAAELARHARASHDLVTAARASIRAGDEAMEVGGPDEAAHHYEHALGVADEPTVRSALEEAAGGFDRVDLCLRASAAAEAAGHPFRAIALVEDELRSMPDDAPPLSRARLLLGLAKAVISTDSQVDALAATSEAMSLVETGTASPLHAELLAIHARASAERGRLDEAKASARQAVAMANQVGSPAIAVDAATTLASLLRRAHDPATTEASLLEIVDDARRARDVGAELRSLFNLGIAHLEQARIADALVVFRRTWDRAVEEGRPWSPYGISARLQAVVAARIVGDWDFATSAADTSGESPPDLARALLAAVSLEVAAGKGAAGALAGADWLRAWWGKDGLIAILSAGAMIELLGQKGDVAAARALHDDAVDTVARVWGTPDFQARIRLAALLVGQYASAAGRAATAERSGLASSGAALTKAAGTVADAAGGDGRSLGAESAAWLARVHAEDGRLRWLSGVDPLGLDELVSRWEAAVDGFDELGDVYEAARSRARLAAVLQASGRAAQAQHAADEARRVARRLGAARLLEELQAVAAPERAASAPPAVQGGSALTPREAEVLELVAAGRSNREIGEQLFISAKTVSVHVSNVLAKLDANGRTEAVAIARRQGLIT